MLPEYGVDYSWGRPGGAAIRASGFTYAMRYVKTPGDNGKGLTVAERDDLHSNGVGIGLVFETSANRHLDGYFAGQYDASQYVAPQLRLLDWPQNRPVYFAVDFDAMGEALEKVRDYQLGVLSILGSLQRVGIYGGYEVVRDAHDREYAGWFWQSLAWQHGRGVYPNANLFQYQNGQILNGAAVDYNRSINPDFGIWRANQLQPETVEERVARLEVDNAELRLQLAELNRYVLGRFAILKTAAIDAANPDIVIPPAAGG